MSPSVTLKVAIALGAVLAGSAARFVCELIAPGPIERDGVAHTVWGSKTPIRLGGSERPTSQQTHTLREPASTSTQPEPATSADSLATLADSEEATEVRAEDADAQTLYELYHAAGKTDVYRKLVDHVTARPLGRHLSECDPTDLAWVIDSETPSDMKFRQTRLNARVGKPLLQVPFFQFLAFRCGGSLEAIGGDFGGHVNLDLAQFAAMEASRAGATRERLATPEFRERSGAFAMEWGKRMEKERRHLLTVVWEEAAPVTSGEVSVVLGAEGKMWILYLGDDPQLDRILDNLAREYRELDGAVDLAFR